MHRVFAIATAMAVSATLLSGPAQAAGYLKGALVGGVAGHYAGNHGLLGAGAGCLIGRHYANKHARQQMNPNSRNGYSRPRLRPLPVAPQQPTMSLRSPNPPVALRASEGRLSLLSGRT